MPGAQPRDLAEVQPPIERWFTEHLHGPSAGGAVQVELSSLAGGGYSNEIIVATVSDRTARRDDDEPRRYVVRLPPRGDSLFPRYDLAVEVAAQEIARGGGVAVPAPLVHEPDPSWLGTPFLVMPMVDGHCPGELPALDPWVTSLTSAEQRTVHDHALEQLARIHTSPWADHPRAALLRGTGVGRDAGVTLADEVAWWRDLAAWVFGGELPAVVAASFDWCDRHRPTDEPPCGLLWGDVRLGNVLVGDDLQVTAVLDWEMASIGPAELDLAWFTALDAMSATFVDRRVPGFPSRDEIVAHHERALGRPMVSFRWFEVFALCRSAVLGIRTDRLESIRRGKPPRSLEGNGLLRYLADAIDAGGPVG